MKIRIDVTDRKEGELIRCGLEHPETRALVKVMGVLLLLKSDRERRRVLAFVADKLAENAEEEAMFAEVEDRT